MKNEEITQRILNELGLSARYYGYFYTLQAIELISKDESLLTQTTKVLYVDIAQIYSTTPVCVEKNIRYCIDIIWKYTDEYSDLIQQIFGHNYLNRKPSNKVFLELLYNHSKTLEFNGLHIKTCRCPLFGCKCSAIVQYSFSDKSQDIPIR